MKSYEELSRCGGGGQGGKTWQPFVGSKNGNENFRQARVRKNDSFDAIIVNIFTIFASNASFLRVIANLQT